MSNEKHNGTRRYCGECMHLVEPIGPEDVHACNPARTRNDPGEWLDAHCGYSACALFIPSLEAQRLEQMKRIADALNGNTVAKLEEFIAHRDGEILDLKAKLKATEEKSSDASWALSADHANRTGGTM